MRRVMVLGLAGLFSATAIAACGDDDDDSASEVQDANAEFCQDLVAYGTAVDAFADLDPASATTDDYTSAADEVRSAREDLVASGEDLAEAEWTNLQTQIETLSDQLADAPDDEAVASILADAEAQVTTVRASIATLNTAACTSANTTATTD